MASVWLPHGRLQCHVSLLVQHHFPTLETVLAEPYPSHMAFCSGMVPKVKYKESSFAHPVPDVGAERDSTSGNVRDIRPFGTSLIDLTASDLAVPWGLGNPGY